MVILHNFQLIRTLKQTHKQKDFPLKWAFALVNVSDHFLRADSRKKDSFVRLLLQWQV